MTFADGLGGLTNYPPVRGRWAPAIAGIRTSPLGGRGPYADVEEDLSCNIRDSTAALCWSRLDTLARLLDKAERWWLRNEQISPVVLKYAPQGSTIHSTASPMQAIVLGRVGSDELNGIDLPSNANDAGMLFEIYGIKVACMRRGGWTGANESVTAGTSGQATVIPITYASTHPVSSPVSLHWLGFGTTTTPILRAGYSVIGSSANDIQVFEAETGTAANFTSVADAANTARGGSVLRYTPVATTAALTGAYTITGSINGPVAIIAAVRNNSGTTTFQISANMYGLGVLSSTPPLLIDTSTLNPRLVNLGTVQTVSAISLGLSVTASAASGTLDIDYFILVNLRDETVNIVAWDEFTLATVLAGTVTLEMDFNFNPTADHNPAVAAQNGAGSIAAPLTYRGALPYQSSGINLYALWASTNGESWRFTNATPAVLAPTPQVVRYRAFLSPQ